jgi:hypothetical protein
MRARFELFREWHVVEEDPGVVVLVIEPVLELTHGLHGALYVRLGIGCEHEECCIFAEWLGWWMGWCQWWWWVWRGRVCRVVVIR